ncbi:cache domain-containing sensor histidine kinase [Cohnella abietis]|uniref:Sensor histidine kinase YesM n=1 Tax=Cohnella abietis TaxID=2507935 RepID=A0A3T1DBL5_9BACL|nr:histidine kinase [Cohnella abietis]BBI35444.1 sensor histidine kinase YesM [Cohnella abietis]
MNLIQKLIVFFILLIVIPVLLAYWIVSVKVAKITEGQMGDTLFQLVKTSHHTLDRDIVSVDGATERLMISPETRQMFDMTPMSEYDHLQKYLVLDKLLTNYSKNLVNYSVFIPQITNEFPFAPPSDVKANGVFFSCDISSSSWFQDALNAKGTGIIRIMNRTGDNRAGIKTAAYIRSMNNYLDDNSPKGVLVMTGLDELMRKDLETLKIPKDGQIVLLNKGNIVLANTSNIEIGSTFKLPQTIFRSTEGVFIDREEGKSWLYAINSSTNSGTKLLFKIPISSIIGEHEAMRELVNYLMIVYFCILLIAILYFLRHILSPLSRLARLSRSFEPGRPLTNEYMVNRKDEIGLLNNAFFDMTKRLNQTIHDKYELELKHKEAELTILHSQINPHLLYNTLESIFWRTSIEGNTESAEMIRDLSLLMRIGLSRGKTLIPISEELNHIEAYLRLQLKRNNYSFAIHWEIEEETKSYLIPKVVLQPLVENSIIHGIRKMEKDGQLWIKINMVENKIMILIEDNGYKAVNLSKLNDILKGTLPDEGYGMINVNKRIKLHFGEHYGLSFEHRSEGGTRVILIIAATSSDEI